ncbi:MAG TPA: hypothetical protein VI524_03995 [Anaerolineales bacterium]|nr:hypothetical protein [Anaerolineales bacterium]
MAEPMYFQWQNEVLLKTIYPLREMKLRDFLTYYREIDLWSEYKDKRIEALQAEVQAHIAARENALVAAYKSYKTLYAYFTQGEVRSKYMAKYRLTDETELAKVRELHRTFMTYLPKYADVRKEKYFVTQQVSLWEQHRKALLQEVARRQRRLNIMLPEHPKRPIEEQELQKFQKVTLAIVEEELERLYAFVSTYNKIEKRKLELYKAQESAQTGSKGVRTKLDGVRMRLKPLEAKQGEVSAALARLRTPPDPASVEADFSSADVTGRIKARFPQVDQAVLSTINSFHRDLAKIIRETKDSAVKLISVRNQAYKIQDAKKKIEKQIIALESNLHTMPEGSPQRVERETTIRNLKEMSLQALVLEMDKLNDLIASLEYAKKTRAELDLLIQAREKEMLGVQQTSSQLGKEATDLEQQLKAMEAILHVPEDEYLVHYSPDQPITIKDIVRGKVEEYKTWLAQKSHLELLEEIVQRFLKQPERYPLWLQYMVIHFSGMRYATAHGSWADPKDLLIGLRTSAIEKDFKKMDDDAVEALSQERIQVYESSNGSTPDAPKLAQSRDPKWREKIAHYLRGLKSPYPYYRRKALFDLRLDEENYEVDTMTAEDALEALESLKDELPDWMWKEIVRLTDLRVKEANDPNWEKLTPAEDEERNEARYAELRAIMNKWKQDHLTGWREEHDRSNRLIVTRSVCNEVAEQIQHLRGHTPPGGLTAKAPWYLKNEREARIPGSPRPYFVRPASLKDYHVGASILWLRFVHEPPNPWRVAQPLHTKSGDGLIPAKYLGRKSAALDSWIYTQGDVVKRTRTRLNEKKQKVRDEQWLRWIHEATVAEVAETVDGPVILTFETALPYDDPRMSAVGVFKHDLDDLMFDGGEETYNGSFVGYLPEGKVPAGDLEQMLDWNKILRRQVMTPAQLEDYRKKYIRKA